MTSIEQIAHYNTWHIRHQVLYPHQPFEFVMLEEDLNAIHFGLFNNADLASVVSVFIRGKELQFRKFATLPTFQGKGYGTILLQHIIQFAKQESIERIWCNARRTALSFYKKSGFAETTQIFTGNGIEYVIMELYLN